MRKEEAAQTQRGGRGPAAQGRGARGALTQAPAWPAGLWGPREGSRALTGHQPRKLL